MKLDEINDIEILRNKLKESMIKCIKDCNIGSSYFKKDEWYKIEMQANFEYREIYITDDKNQVITFGLDEIDDMNTLHKYFDLDIEKLF